MLIFFPQSSLEPLPPSIIGQISGTATSVTVLVGDVSGPSAFTSFRVWYSLDDGPRVLATEIGTTEGTATIEGLIPNTTYGISAQTVSAGDGYESTSDFTDTSATTGEISLS